MRVPMFEPAREYLLPLVSSPLWSATSDAISKFGYQEMIAKRLSDAVKIPTEVSDGMGHIGEDRAWNIFYKFTDYLENTFTIAFEHLNHETVNEHGHLLTWEGVNSSLKPLLIMAHTDVVPATIETTDSWTYEPYSGYYDGEFIWGRGSEDDKSNVVVVLSIIELLLQHAFKPQRTIIVALGFDEEGGAEKSYGARCIAEKILERYGVNGLELIFDEGMAGIEMEDGNEVAQPAIAEKGYLDVTMTIDTPGGLTQAPPEHTGIGLLAQAIQIVEDRKLRPRMSSSDSMGTTTAVTVVKGGDKVNSLPETSYAIVNHRIGTQDSVEILKDHYISLLLPWAKRNQLNMIAFEKQLANQDPVVGTFRLASAYDLDPSPVTSTEDPHYHLLASTLRTVFGSHIIVTPTILQGNTDTRYYWDLSTQIYRMSPWRASHDPRGTRMHTVDERMPIAGLMEGCRFYAALILSMDGFRA